MRRAAPIAYLRVAELAALVGLSPDRIYARIQTGELPTVLDGRVRLVPVDAARRLWPAISDTHLWAVWEMRQAGAASQLPEPPGRHCGRPLR